jgi:hypothetical protein
MANKNENDKILYIHIDKYDKEILKEAAKADRVPLTTWCRMKLLQAVKK